MLTEPALLAATTVALTLAFARPLFVFCDGRAARRRLAGPRARARGASRPRGASESAELRCARVLDHVARAVRNRQSSAEALSVAVLREPDTAVWFAPVVVAHVDGAHLTAAAALVGNAPPAARRAANQLAAAGATGSLDAAALERAAALLRGLARNRDDARAATAHVRLSLRLLSVVPVAVIAASLVLQPTAREAVTTPSILGALVAATVLNLAGRSWMGRLTGDLS